MHRVFAIGKRFRVPDGTLVAPLFNPLDSLSGLPADLFNGFSIAAGTIEARTKSSIHLMPHVTQLTVVRAGAIELRMQGPEDPAPYALRLVSHQAALTPAGTLVQLINDGHEDCDVYYVVSPSYLFEMREGHMIYDDALNLGEDWTTLATRDWRSDASIPPLRARELAAARLGQNPIPKRTP